MQAITPDEARLELAVLEAEIQRRRYAKRGDQWVAERLGERLWSKQVEIMLSVANNRRTAVPSAFDTGKSFIASRIAAWWIDIHPPGKAFVVSTASNFSQVKNILWRELGRAHAKGQLPGRLNQTAWYLPITDEHGNTREEIVAIGRKPEDNDETGFHGIHTRWVLAIIDEAAGVGKVLHNSIEGLITNEESRILSIGNPDDASSEFAKVCLPGSGWNVIPISAFDTPNFTGEEMPEAVLTELVSKLWVEEKKKKWGEKSSSYIAKVLGQFPENRKDGLFPLNWIKDAMDRSLPETGKRKYGVDVGAGGDSSIVARRVGGRVRIIHKSQNPNTMQTCGEIVALYRKEDKPPEEVNVDKIGIGKGVADRGAEQGLPFIGIGGADKPVEFAEKSKRDKDKKEEQFVNRRAQAYWGLREHFELGTIDIDPEDEELIEQLKEIRYFYNSKGKIQIEAKEDFIDRLGHSPDEMDAVVLAFIVNPPQAKGTTSQIEIMEF